MVGKKQKEMGGLFTLGFFFFLIEINYNFCRNSSNVFQLENSILRTCASLISLIPRALICHVMT